MEIKRVAFAIVVVALIIAGSLAGLKDEEILSGQYKRYVSLVKQADLYVIGHKYGEASQVYMQALKINPGDSKIWNKYQKSERETLLLEVKATLPNAVPHDMSPVPRVQPQGGMIIEEDEGC